MVSAYNIFSFDPPYLNEFFFEGKVKQLTVLLRKGPLLNFLFCLLIIRKVYILFKGRMYSDGLDKIASRYYYSFNILRSDIYIQSKTCWYHMCKSSYVCLLPRTIIIIIFYSTLNSCISNNSTAEVC